MQALGATLAGQLKGSSNGCVLIMYDVRMTSSEGRFRTAHFEKCMRAILRSRQVGGQADHPVGINAGDMLVLLEAPDDASAMTCLSGLHGRGQVRDQLLRIALSCEFACLGAVSHGHHQAPLPYVQKSLMLAWDEEELLQQQVVMSVLSKGSSPGGFMELRQVETLHLVSKGAFTMPRQDNLHHSGSTAGHLSE